MHGTYSIEQMENSKAILGDFIESGKRMKTFLRISILMFYFVFEERHFFLKSFWEVPPKKRCPFDPLDA